MSSYAQKINKLEEYEPFFKAYLDDEVIKSIQYISHRKNGYKWVLLVGLNNLDFSEKILSFTPRILLDIKKNIEEKTEDIWERKRIPKDIQVFEYNLQQAREKKKEINKLKKIEDEKICAWKREPFSYLKTTEEEERASNFEMVKEIKGVKYIIPLKTEGSWDSVHREKQKEVLANLILRKWDFMVTDRYKKEMIYLKVDDMYWKFKYAELKNIKILISDTVGFCELHTKNFPTETTKTTYEKWKQICDEDIEDNRNDCNCSSIS